MTRVEYRRHVGEVPKVVQYGEEWTCHLKGDYVYFMNRATGEQEVIPSIQLDVIYLAATDQTVTFPHDQIEASTT